MEGPLTLMFWIFELWNLRPVASMRLQGTNTTSIVQNCYVTFSDVTVCLRHPRCKKQLYLWASQPTVPTQQQQQQQQPQTTTSNNNSHK